MVSKHNCPQKEPELLRGWLILDLNPRGFWKIWKHQLAKRLSRLPGCGTSLVAQGFDPTCGIAKKSTQKHTHMGFSHGSVVKNPPANAGDRFDP